MWTQPILTANGTIGQSNFAVASGGGADSDAYKAFDSSAGSYVNKMNSGAWLKFFSKPFLAISDILITSEGSLPSQGIFQVSYDNGVTWKQCGSWQDTDKRGESAHVVIDSGSVTGQFFRFLSQGKSLAMPNNNADFCNVAITADIAVKFPVSFNADIERKVKNANKYFDYLTVYLPFDTSPTADLCGNSWTAYGSPTIEDDALKLDGSSYLQLSGSLALGGQDFTICGRATMDADTTRWYPGIFAFNGNQLRLIGVGSQTSNLEIGIKGSVSTVTTSELTKEFHYEIDYHHASGKWQLFINGTQVFSKISSLSRTTYANAFVGSNGDSSPRFWGGTIDEFMIYDGVALHTENFTPPTADDYIALKLSLGSSAPLNFIADVERRVSNRVEVAADLERILRVKWRYFNLGYADDLIVSGTTLTDLPESQSRTGTAFYQTTRAKCFDLPATPEVWIKFDVYFDGSNRWRAYNVGTTGITAQTDGEITFFSNDVEAYAAAGKAAKNQLQTVLLHMVSGSSAGVVEAWVDGSFIHRYTGDVNHGEDFADIYLQSDGAGTFFSNLIISNYQIGFGDGYQIFSADLQRGVKNLVSFRADIIRYVIQPIVVPLIGEHFNHFIPLLEVFGGAVYTVILPKKGDVWFFRDYGCNIRVFNDVYSKDFQGESDFVHFTDTDRFFIEVTDAFDDSFDLRLYNLKISDGELNEMTGESLSGYTTKSLSADIQITFNRSVSFDTDTEIKDVLPVFFPADFERNIITNLELFATDNSEYFSGGSSAPIVIPTQKIIPPAAQNTTGLQSVEISISEQQITDAVKFSGIIPFDIMFPVVGLYLDFVYNMRVEKVQRQGVLYSCDCCSNLDELLFTQLDYTLAQKTTWYQEDADGNSQEIETYYPPASEHVQKIADALGLIPVLQFDDFLSTVLQDDVGGRTYNDLIRDIFGWSSRIPTHLINVFIRDGKLFVIQRGHEANLIDISGADMTLPVVTHELVRTTWGSKPWSATEVVGKLGLDVPDDTVVGSSQDDEEDTWVTVQDVSYGIDWQAVTTYFYYQKMLTVVDPDSPVNKRAGLLYKVEINKTYAFGVDKPDSFTQIFHEYDEDRNKIQTITDVQYLGFISGELPPDTRTINQMHYITLPNGEKFLASESTQTYEDDKLVDSTFTSHSPSRLGQTHVIKLDDDGDIVGEVVGQDTGDDRVTPFSESKAAEFLNSLPDKQQIIDGLPLFDSSFPIHNQDKLIELTDALKWLNRKTCETVTLSIYGFPHLIDFNDRILLNGYEFFLVSNNAKTTPRIFNEQNLTLRRWF